MMNPNRKNRIKAKALRQKRADFVKATLNGRFSFLDPRWDRGAKNFIETGDARYLKDFPCKAADAPAILIPA